MDYQKIYNQLVTRRQNEILSKEIYGEIHHIVPKCLGGNNDKSNLVRLTAREHYIAHLLLAKIHNTFGLYSAVIFMQTGHIENRKFKFNSRLYENMRQAFAKKNSELKKGQIPWNKGKNMPIESIQKMKTHKFSDEHRKKLSLAKKGKPSNRKGKSFNHSEEAKRKISESQIGKKFFNNGKINVFCYECPDGFIKGRISKKN